MSERVGFLGLGTMGLPMATRLADAGYDLVVWNRTSDRCDALAERGAEVATTPSELLERVAVCFIMLSDGPVVDRVLGRRGGDFECGLEGRTLVAMSTVTAEYSIALAEDLERAGARYVEAPISGSRVPAEQGQLVSMVAGDPEEIDEIRPLLDVLCSRVVYCGSVGSGLAMKHATNLLLLPLLVGLGEAVVYSRRAGLDVELLSEVVTGGQIGSPVLRAKLQKIIIGDYSAQGTIWNALESVEKSIASARDLGLEPAVAELCRDVLKNAAAGPLRDQDIAAVCEWLADRGPKAYSPTTGKP